MDDDVSIDELREAVEHMHGVPARSTPRKTSCGGQIHVRQSETGIVPTATAPNRLPSVRTGTRVLADRHICVLCMPIANSARQARTREGRQRPPRSCWAPFSDEN
jgi:hypothetical protein